MKVDTEQVRQLRGCQARLWEFTATHNMLVVRFVKPDRSEMFLLFGGCHRISVRSDWRVVDPRVIRAEATGEDVCDTYLFIDDAPSIYVGCQGMEFHTEFNGFR